MHIGGERILNRVFQRVCGAEEVDETWVTVGDEPENDALTELCERRGYSYLQGPEDNLLRRHLEVAEESDCDTLIRVTGDCPFVPSNEIDRLVKIHERNDARYTTNFSQTMPIGSAVDVIDVGVLQELHDMGETHPVKLLRENPEEWSVEVTTNERLERYSEVHFAVDTPEDYWTLTDAVDDVGSDTSEILKWISENE